MRPGLNMLFLMLVLFLSGSAHPAREVPIPLVFTQLPPQAPSEQDAPTAGWSIRSSWGEKGRIVRLVPGAKTQILTSGFFSASDPEISFDGQRILFAGKRKSGDLWNIFEMDSDGSSLRQITRDLGNCRHPVYQSAFYTIVSSQPWYQIAFTSDLQNEANEAVPVASTSLYSCLPDGTGVQRLTYNPSDDLDPFLMPDGRLLFSSWQRSTLRRGHLGRIALFALNLDGTDLTLFAGEQGLPFKRMPAVTADRKLAVFVESRQLAWDGAGQLAAVEMRRNLHSYRTLTRDQRWLYHSPYPLPDGRILVSRRPAGDKGTHGIYRLDPSTGETEQIFDSAQHHDLQARFQVPRTEPDGRSSIVAESEPDGQLYCLNVYQSDWSRPEWLPPGSVARLRVLEGVPRKLTASRDHSQSGTLSEPPLLQKRILGEIPIEQDGSFFIQIPANTPVQLQTLDERGLALQTCGWIWSRNNEPRGCIGCHEDGELTPTNRLVDAVKKPPLQLTLPPARRRVVDFRRDVAPILAGPCSSPSCHGSQGVQPGLLPETNQAASAIEADVWKPVYESLLGKLQGGRGRSDSEQGIHPGEARNSPLIWHLFGENTSRPWDELGGQPKVDVSAQLTDEQRKVFVEWIDLGALWDGIPQAAPASQRVPSDAGGRLGGKK